jgi:hypothetical protein
LLPDTIGGRTLVALVVGLLLSHLASMAIYYGDREIALELIGAEHIGERIVTVSRLVENASPAERARLVALAGNPKLGVTLGRQAAIEDDAAAGWRTEVLRRALAAHFGAGREPNFRIHYATSGNAGEEAKAGDGPSDGKTLLVAVRLTDGGWLNFAAPIESSKSLWSLRFVLSVAVMIAAVVILSAFVVHHLTAPLRTFALAARRLGRDVGAPPLPDRGPREVRQAVRAFNDMQDRVRCLRGLIQMVAAISDLQTRSPGCGCAPSSSRTRSSAMLLADRGHGADDRSHATFARATRQPGCGDGGSGRAGATRARLADAGWRWNSTARDGSPMLAGRPRCAAPSPI